MHNLLEMAKKLLIGQFFFCNSEFLERKENTKKYWGKSLLLFLLTRYRFLLLLAHLAKGKVSFCHHLASVVCRPLTFHILIFSSESPQSNEVKLGRNHLWNCSFCPNP